MRKPRISQRECRIERDRFFVKSLRQRDVIVMPIGPIEDFMRAKREKIRFAVLRRLFLAIISRSISESADRLAADPTADPA